MVALLEGGTLYAWNCCLHLTLGLSRQLTVCCCIIPLLLQLRLGIDDPLDSSAVHLVNGVLGMLLLAFVARPQHVQLLTDSPCGGIFYTRLGWMQLGMQTLGELLLLLLS